MIEQVRGRLTQLEQEYQAGAQQLAELVRQESGLRETLLRISGAVQVLRELVAAAGADAAADHPAPVAAGNGAHGPGGSPDGAVLTVP